MSKWLLQMSKWPLQMSKQLLQMSKWLDMQSAAVWTCLDLAIPVRR